MGNFSLFSASICRLSSCVSAFWREEVKHRLSLPERLFSVFFRNFSLHPSHTEAVLFAVPVLLHHRSAQGNLCRFSPGLFSRVFFVRARIIQNLTCLGSPFPLM